MPSNILAFSRPGTLLPLARDGGFEAEIQHPALAKLYRLWCEWARPGGIAMRHEITPEVLRPWLGYLAIAEIERNPFRFRYRLVGTGLTELAGYELTGRYVDELYSRKVRREVIEAYRGVVTERRPHYRHARFWLVIKMLGYHRLILPFSSNGTDIDVCLLALFPDRADIARAGDWQSQLDREEVAAWFGRPLPERQKTVAEKVIAAESEALSRDRSARD